MTAVSRGQALEVTARVATQVDWDAIDGARLQEQVINLSSQEFGSRFTAFLQNGAQPIVGLPSEKTVSTVEQPKPPNLVLDCSEPLDLASFLGKGWSVWRGPADGDGLKGEEEQDVRSQALKRVDFGSQARFETCLRGESSVKGETKLLRLKETGGIRGAGNVFLALWKDYQARGENSVLERLWKTRKIRYLDFFGLVLRDLDGDRFVLYLYRDGSGEWRWRCSWLDDDWLAGNFSLLLASELLELKS